MGIDAGRQLKRSTVLLPEHRKYPYPLWDMVIERPNKVECADITNISMQRGFLHLVTIMDWATRRVQFRRLPNTMDIDFCI